MDQREIEIIVGRLYLLVMHYEQQLADARVQITELTPKPPMPPTIFSIATPRDDSA